MKNALNLETCLTLYTYLMLGLGTLSYIIFRLNRKNMNWQVSQARLRTCKKCGNVFLVKRQELDKRCPLCGENSRKFRLPHSVLLNQ